MEKNEGGTLWGKFFNEIFEQCHSADKCKRVLQNIETNEGGPLDAIQKVSKKVA